MGLDPSKLSTGFLRAIHREPVKRPANAPQKPPVTSEAPKPYQHATHAQIDHSGTNPKLEQPALHEPLAEAQGKEGAATPVRIRIVSVRKRLCDPDNLSEKWHLDCLRYCGAIDGDEPDKITLETTQRKAAKGEVEHTEIEVTYFS